jgi:hypothetical protein
MLQAMVRPFTHAAHALALALAIQVVACGGLKAMNEDSAATRAAIKTDLGVDSEIGWRTSNGTSGRQLFVNVHLQSIPPGEAVVVQAKVKSIVTSHFREPVTRVDVSM